MWRLSVSWAAPVEMPNSRRSDGIPGSIVSLDIGLSAIINITMAPTISA